MEPDKNTFDRQVGRRLRALRIGRGRSQAELGQILGLTFQQVQKYERGNNKISAERLWLLARHFQVEVHYFFDDIEAPLPPSGHDEARLRDGSSEHHRLRLEIGRGLAGVKSPKMLREMLTLIRSITDAREPHAAEQLEQDDFRCDHLKSGSCSNSIV